MARGYRRFSPADEDEIWERLRLVMQPSPLLVRWDSRPGRCGGIWCGVVGSGPLRGVGLRDG